MNSWVHPCLIFMCTWIHLTLASSGSQLELWSLLWWKMVLILVFPMHFPCSSSSYRCSYSRSSASTALHWTCSYVSQILGTGFNCAFASCFLNTVALTKTFTIWGQHFTRDCVRYFIFNCFVFYLFNTYFFQAPPPFLQKNFLPHTTHDVLLVDLLQYLVVESGTTWKCGSALL